MSFVLFLAMAVTGRAIREVDIAGAWAYARERSGMKQEVLAALMGISHNQLANNLANYGHLSFRRVLRIASDDDGLNFLRYFVLDLIAQVGEDIDAIIKVTAIEMVAERLINRIQPTMAKASLRTHDRKRETA